MHGPQCCRAAFLKLYQLLPQSIYRAHRVLCNQGPDNQGDRCGSRTGGLGFKRCSVPSQPIGPTSSPSLSTIAHSQVKHSADASPPSGTARQSWVMSFKGVSAASEGCPRLSAKPLFQTPLHSKWPTLPHYRCSQRPEDLTFLMQQLHLQSR